MMLNADNWCVKVSGKVYGPYSSQQLQKFAHEGRIAEWSLVAPAGSKDWREAQAEGTFAKFFGVSRPRRAGEKAFGRRKDAADTPSSKQTSPAGTAISLVEKSTGSSTARKPQQLDPHPSPAAASLGPSNFIIIFDIVSGAASRVEAAILGLGNGLRLADNVWSVNCELSAIGVRNTLAPYLRPRETLFVIDSAPGRTTWQNYPPQAHAKITELYAQLRR